MLISASLNAPQLGYRVWNFYTRRLPTDPDHLLVAILHANTPYSAPPLPISTPPANMDLRDITYHGNVRRLNLSVHSPSASNIAI